MLPLKCFACIALDHFGRHLPTRLSFAALVIFQTHPPLPCTVLAGRCACARREPCLELQLVNQFPDLNNTPHSPHPCRALCLQTYVRAHDVNHALNLEKAGATAVVPEILEPSLQLAAAVLTRLDWNGEEVCLM